MSAVFSSVLNALRLRPLRQVPTFEARPLRTDLSTGGAKAWPLWASINPPAGERPLLARGRRRQSTFTGRSARSRAASMTPRVDQIGCLAQSESDEEPLRVDLTRSPSHEECRHSRIPIIDSVTFE